MRKLAIHGIPQGRVRGLRRKCQAMVESIGDLAECIPVEYPRVRGYWHAKLPVSQAFIDSPRAPRSVRCLCIQAMLDAAEQIRNTQSSRKIDCRVVTTINLPNLFSSEIIVFFGDDYFSRFFDRNTPEHSWVALPLRRSLQREWSLRLPAGWIERGYKETIADEDHHHVGEIWFFGDL